MHAFVLLYIGNDIMLSKYIHGNGYMHVDAAHKGIHDALHFPMCHQVHTFTCAGFFHLPVTQCIYNI